MNPLSQAHQSFRDLVSAHNSAGDSLLKIISSETHYFVKDISKDLVIKEFKPEEKINQVLNWIDNKYPNGIYLTVSGNKILRFKQKSLNTKMVEQAVKIVGEWES